MLHVFDSLRDISFLTVLFRMALSFACGMLVGIERSAKNRPAGFRTHILVCLGAATASLTGHYIYLNMQMPADVSRLGAQVITGIGFIGAGAIIITKKQTLKGLTTAAGLWTCGIVGLAFGAGFYEGGLIATCLILLVQTVFSSLNLKIRRYPEFSINVQYQQKSALDHTMRTCKDNAMAITGLHISGTSERSPVYTAQISLRSSSGIEPEALLEYIRPIKGVLAAQLIEGRN